MQFPRYELVVAADRGRPPPTPHPRPRRVRPARRVRAQLRALAPRRRGRLDAQEYLRLEFAVEDRR